MHSNTEITTEEEPKEDYKETISGSESQNDQIPLLSVSQQQEQAWSPRKHPQHVHSTQDNLKTTQCFVEGLDENFDDSIPGTCIYMMWKLKVNYLCKL